MVEVLPAGAAGDEAVVAAVVKVINTAYAVGERGLWIEGQVRTHAAEVARLIGGGGMLVARADGRIVGCARMWEIAPGVAELGFVSAAPDVHGTGVGRELMDAAEALARERGVTTMQLELLVPRDRPHPAKEQLRAWYERCGYVVVRSAPFEEIATHATAELATPCEFLVFSKPLD